MQTNQKPVIGFTCGDLNGIGIELIIKSLADQRILDHCVPVIFGSNKVINFYRKSMPELNVSYQNARELNNLNPKQVNIFNCWEEDVSITPGILNETGGTYAAISLLAAADMLKQKRIDGLVTAPIHKKNIQSPAFNFTGHTPFLKTLFGVNDVVMMMCAGKFRVALATEHIQVSDIANHITKELLSSKLGIINQSLQKDFGIDKPKIAVLGLNPHAGDEGLLGKEEETLIRPAVKEAKNNNLMVIGPYSADAFFARGNHHRFDVVLAMYHDQGLIPFKSLSTSEGINYTAGLPAVRTSPDHGVAFDIAGKNIADTSSFLSAIFECIDIIRQRSAFEENRKNPLRKLTPSLLANVEDEKIDVSEE